MRKLVIVILAMLALPLASAGLSMASDQQITINFDQLPYSNAYLPPDYFAPQGVIFSSLAGGSPYIRTISGVSVTVDPYSFTYSPQSAIAGARPASIGVSATFVDPSTGLPGTTSFVQVVACSGPSMDTLSDNVALRGFDSEDNLVVSADADPSLQWETLSISAPTIARVEMVADSRLDVFDNFTFEEVGPIVMEVNIDIKPGSLPNCFNNDSHGVIPVAILTTDTFDAATVDPFSLTLDGAAARVKGKSGSAGSLEDVDSDGDLDLVVQIEDVDETYQVGDTIATLTGETFDGLPIHGQDTICIVPR